MAGRRTQRSETLYEPLKFLSELRGGRDAITRALATVRPTGETARLLAVVLVAIDALAVHLTGREGHFHDDMHRTP